MPQCYQPPAKNARALTQVTAWLKAVKVPVQPSNAPGCDLTVRHHEGHPIQVKVAMSGTEARPPTEHLFVLGKELTSKHSDVALRAFHEITITAGYGMPSPVNRGPEPEKKLHFSDHFDEVAFRHMEFRRVPNPDDAELKHYEPTIKKAVAKFMYINEGLCRRFGMEFGDVMTIAMVLTCNYLGLYKVENPTQNDNERKLHAYLTQRLPEVAQLMAKKSRNCFPDVETASIALLGRIYDRSIERTRHHISSELEASFEEVQEAALEAEVDEAEDLATDPSLSTDPSLEGDAGPQEAAVSADPTSIKADNDKEFRKRQKEDAKRREAAKDALKRALASMEHDPMVELLTTASTNASYCYDARLEAQKQLRLHRKSCPSCVAQMQEEHAGADARG